MKQIIADRKFENGFELHHVDKLVTNRPIAIFTLKNTAKAYPSWQLAQWCCKSNLANGSEKVRQDASYEISDDSKKVIVDTERGYISLALDASNEYTVPRREGEGWPHILIEQDFPYKPKIFSCKKIMLDIDFCIDRVIDKHKEGERTDIHTAQFSWIFALADKKPGKGYDDFVWFGCPIYDARCDIPGFFAAQDGGKPENTGKYIYFIDGKNYLSEGVRIGKRTRLKIDVTQHMRDALLCAKERHFIPYSELSDIVLNNTNLGWEITGTFDASLTIYSLSVEVEE